MSMDGQQAIDKIADAFWWLRGFASARPNDNGAFEAMEAARMAQHWLRRLLNGDGIVIRADERPADKQGYRIAISEAQFDRLHDGLRSSNADDRADGLACATEIFEKLTRELAAIRHPNSPF
jgi:hypothetical protein